MYNQNRRNRALSGHSKLESDRVSFHRSEIGQLPPGKIDFIKKQEKMTEKNWSELNR